MCDENGHSLQRGEEEEQPLYDGCVDALAHHEKAQHPGDAQDGHQHEGGMEQGAAVGRGGRGEGGGREGSHRLQEPTNLFCLLTTRGKHLLPSFEWLSL